jgi:hypothetical protein
VSSPPSNQQPQDYDLTCWYLNIRRVVELLGTQSIAAEVRDIEALARIGDAMRVNGILASLKTGLTRWLHETNPPTLGQLLVQDGLRPGLLFTHYDNFFCKGLRQIDAGLQKGRTAVPPAEAYAKLDSFRQGLKVCFRFHHEHLTSNSSWSELSGQRRLLILGAATDITGDRIEAIPWVIANPLPGLSRPSTLVGAQWGTRLELHVDCIDSFSLVREEPHPPSRKELDALKDVPERDIKQAFAEIISEPSVPLDWGGEQSDLFSSHVIVDGKRISTAFAFKGPAKFHPMTMADLGKNGDQINRLFAEPAGLLVLQHCHEITAPVRDTMRAFAQQMGNLRLFCIISGYDTLRILNAYRKCGFEPSVGVEAQ